VKANNSSPVHAPTSPKFKPFLPLAFVMALMSGATLPASGQTPEESAKPEAAAAVQSRIERARALAAAHQLAAAAMELESVRTSTVDDVVRNVTSVMLMNIYLEEGNYSRAEALLEETFQSRASQKDGSIRSYFALAGQAVNGARSHLARYRTFGINVSDPSLPAEAVSDLERLRSLLERMIAQARDITRENPKAYESLALLEDVLGIRVSVARDVDDREKWEIEYALTRQGLASSQRQIAALGGIPPQNSSVKSSRSNASVSSPTVLSKPKEPEASVIQPVNTQSVNESGVSTERVAQPANVSEDAGPPATLSGGMLNERASKRVTPSYPEAAKTAGVAGAVKVYVSINEIGRVAGIFKSEGPELLRKPSEAAARQWRFTPTFIEGKSARLTGYIEFTFPPPVPAKP